MDFLQQAASHAAPVPLSVLALRLGSAFALGFLSAGVYALACRRGERRPDGAFLTTLVLLSLLVTLLTLAVGDNVAKAFSLVGTLSIVRFRTVVDDTRDTAFVIYSVVCGMCAGSGYYLGPIASAPLILFATWLFARPKAKKQRAELPPGRLMVRLSSAINVEGDFKAALNHYLPNHQLVEMATARGGGAWDATYAVEFPAEAQAFKVISALSGIEGVQGVEVKSD